MSDGRNGSGAVSRRLAEFRARDDFYRALFDQAERARRGEALLPVVPPADALTYVDGFLVWKGRPVWWSGESRSAALTAGMVDSGFMNADVISRPLPQPEPRHPGLLRRLGLRWA